MNPSLTENGSQIKSYFLCKQEVRSLVEHCNSECLSVIIITEPDQSQCGNYLVSAGRCWTEKIKIGTFCQIFTIYYSLGTNETQLCNLKHLNH